MDALNRPIQATETGNSPEYEILLNGKKRYLKATTGDIVLSVLLPFWGLVIGGVATAKGEHRRGRTMMLIGVAGLIVAIVLRAI